MERVAEIVKRKDPTTLLSKTPSPRIMAIHILKEMTLPYLKLQMEKIGTPHSISRKKIMAELVPMLVDLIEKDRQEGRM